MHCTAPTCGKKLKAWSISTAITSACAKQMCLSPRAIYAPYREYTGIGTFGTICTLMMDLPAKRLWLRYGNGPANAFVDYQL